jgi:hypothetical protein
MPWLRNSCVGFMPFGRVRIDGVVPSYPNHLRALRDDACLTRHALSAICDRLAVEDPIRFTQVVYRTIQDLEAGLKRPRAQTAATLAAALGKEVRAIFPDGHVEQQKGKRLT